MPVPLESSHASVSWEQSCQSHLRTIVPVSVGSNHASLTWEKLCQSHLGTIVPVPLQSNSATLIWEQSCQLNSKKSNNDLIESLFLIILSTKGFLLILQFFIYFHLVIAIIVHFAEM